MVEFLTNPVVITALLTIAGVGMVLQLFSPKFGLAGLVSILALLFFFYGHYQAGLTGYGTFIMFVIGILLIFLEFFLPGAIAGTLGVCALISSLFLAGDDASQIGISILIALFISIFTFGFMIRVIGKKLVLFNKMVLKESARKEDGYVSNQNRTDLLGKEGISLTNLRPAGTAVFGTERIDVVTEGGYIERNIKITVIKVEGPRIVVREVN